MQSWMMKTMSDERTERGSEHAQGKRVGEVNKREGEGYRQGGHARGS